MTWETATLIAVSALCICIAIWGFVGDYLNNRSDRDARFLRLALTGGGFIDIPTNRHHTKHRAG